MSQADVREKFAGSVCGGSEENAEEAMFQCHTRLNSLLEEEREKFSQFRQIFRGALEVLQELPVMSPTCSDETRSLRARKKFLEKHVENDLELMHSDTTEFGYSEEEFRKTHADFLEPTAPEAMELNRGDVELQGRTEEVSSFSFGAGLENGNLQSAKVKSIYSR